MIGVKGMPNPGALRAFRHQIVRPFASDVGRIEVSCGTRRDEAELRRDRRRAWIDHQRAGVKITLGRDPDAATAASPRSLFVGDDPQPASVAGERSAARLLVG
jgi:hypothetical protein